MLVNQSSGVSVKRLARTRRAEGVNAECHCRGGLRCTRYLCDVHEVVSQIRKPALMPVALLTGGGPVPGELADGWRMFLYYSYWVTFPLPRGAYAANSAVPAGPHLREMALTFCSVWRSATYYTKEVHSAENSFHYCSPTP